MGACFEQIAIAARRGLGYAERLAADVPAELFAAKPRFTNAGKETEIDCNHPAFVFGHLGLYPTRVCGFVGLDGASIAAPAAWTDLFKAGSPCRDDRARTIYPAKDEIMAHFQRSHAYLIDRLPAVDDALLSAPHPDPVVREKYFPTVGMAVIFMLNSHVMVHSGQISTWRRCFGLPGIM